MARYEHFDQLMIDEWLFGETSSNQPHKGTERFKSDVEQVVSLLPTPLKSIFSQISQRLVEVIVRSAAVNDQGDDSLRTIRDRLRVVDER